MGIIQVLTMKLSIMFIFILIGFLLSRKHFITPENSKCLANMLLYLVLPSVIVKGFCIDRTSDRICDLLVSTICSIIILVISILISRLLFSKQPIEHFAAAFSNPGFFAIPLITAIFDSDAVFYIAPFIATLNILQWTYGCSILKGEKTSIHLKNIISSPFMISLGLGLILFLSGFKLPVIIDYVLTDSSSLNVPIAMLLCGVYLSQTDMKAMLFKRSLYKVSTIRLLLIPLVAFILLSLIPERLHILKLSLLIASASPVGTNVAVYAQLEDMNYPYAVETVVNSTLFSMITIPCIVFFAQCIWK